jgi:8-oxo-dGTP pyrophosphatase MutT (NUDIX family)
METSIARPCAAGVVPVRWTEAGWRVLVVRARRAWEFPNGAITPGDDPLQAAERHARKGTGLDDIRFAFGPVFRDPAPYARGKYPRYYLAMTGQEAVRLAPGDDAKLEHHEARWVSFDDAAQLLPQRLTPVVNWARRVLNQAPEAAAAHSGQVPA